MSDLDVDHGSDQEVSENHAKLLDAVSKLDRGQRVKKAQRSEPSLEVSEFNLVKSGISDKDAVRVDDLVKTLGRKGHHAEINKKFKAAKQKAKVLSKPLEKPAADKLKRIVGFENAKKKLEAWNAIVARNRTAESLRFPLNQPSMKAEPADKFVKRFRIQSDLEKELEALEPPKPANEEKPDEFPLTLAEILQKRKESARLRAQQSYKEAKAYRQNKIKSKKFHRIQRKERIKQQMKEFEELQKTDPQAALEKLEQLDKTRAEERMSLRHRSTGQWAKSKQVRAKYDKESRQVLAQQLSISKTLTQKIRSNEESDVDEETSTEITKPSLTDKDNPWVNGKKSTEEIDAFVTGYRKYWENKNKEEEEKKSLTNVEQTNNQKIVKNPTKTTKTTLRKNRLATNPVESVVDYKQKNVNSKINKFKWFKSDENVAKNHVNDVDANKMKNLSMNKNIGKIVGKTKNEKSTIAEMENDDERKTMEIVKPIVKKMKFDKMEKLNFDKMEKSKFEEMEKLKFEEMEKLKFDKMEKLKFDEMKKLKLEKMKKLNNTGTSGWFVETVANNDSKNENKLSTSKSLDIDEMFESMEDKLISQIDTKLRSVKRKLATNALAYEKLEKTKNKKKICNDEKSIDLSFKKQNLRPDMDEEMDEGTGISGNQSERKKSSFQENVELANGITTENSTLTEKSTTEIDPKKFINVKPKHLKTQLPDTVTGGDDALDDSEADEEQHDIISEAFADDDVVEEFRKEKAEEVKSSQPEDLDLRLPGWGSWGGKDVVVSNRKKRRFIMKFPKIMPRRDENKGDVIIIEENEPKLKIHQVSDLPYPFTSVKDFEASIRAPIGRNFVPENAHRRFIEPAVKTKMGEVIEPMDADALLNGKPKSRIRTKIVKSNNKKNKNNNMRKKMKS